MFDDSSRYADLPIRQFQTADGRQVTYRLRRLIPLKKAEVRERTPFGQVDRLDLTAARTLGDPRLFWALCDANRIANPFAFNMTGNRRLDVPET